MVAKILVIAIDQHSLFDDIHSELMAIIRKKAEVTYARKLSTVIPLLSEQPQPTSVFLADGALTVAKNGRAWGAVVNYVRQGGTAIAMGLFSSFTKPNDMKPFFNQAGLDWEVGSYHRTTLVLNTEAVTAAVAGTLLSDYSQKALFIKNVQPEDMWYQTTEASFTESAVFAKEFAHQSDQTAIAFAKVGDGRLGYVGDVNAEQGSDAVILAMCKLEK